VASNAKPFPLLAVTLCIGLSPAYSRAESAQVHIDSGVLVGTASAGVESFKGIPYAAAPVGELRWRAPRAPSSWKQPRAAGDFGASCPQTPPPRVPAGSGAEHTSEDCLTLNVWAPSPAVKSAPVMVWIHGGSNTQGTGAGVYYDGSAFARDGVVLVTINYRLGLLGFFAHPALAREAAGGATANFGLLDQLAALAWVKRNIAALGGDPGNVTVFGESAGAEDTVALLASPASKGLFQKAIVESAPLDDEWPTLAEASSAGARTATALGLSGDQATAAQLRAIPMQRLVQDDLRGSTPVIDGVLLREAPLKALTDGVGIDVPLVIGTNGNEGSLLGANPDLKYFDGINLAALRTLYGTPSESDAEVARRLFRDSRFAIPARRIAGHRAGTAPAYLYRFDYVLSLLRARRTGADHGSEIPYVFSTWGVYPISETDHSVTDVMHSCWVAFARGGAPTCKGAPAWPAYQPQSDLLMHFRDQAVVEKTPDAAALDAIARHDAQDHAGK
jgi:para-nitrobenzyl esterase